MELVSKGIQTNCSFSHLRPRPPFARVTSNSHISLPLSAKSPFQVATPTMFSSNKIFAACIVAVVFSSVAHAEKEVAETLGLLGLHGLGVGVGVDAGVYGGGYPGVGVGYAGYPGVGYAGYPGVGYAGYPVNDGTYASASATAGAGAMNRKLRSVA